MSELKQQIAEILRTTPYGNGVMAPLNRIMGVVEKAEIEARIDEVEYPAAIRAYNAGFGAGEYESFLTADEKHRLKKLRWQLSQEKSNE